MAHSRVQRLVVPVFNVQKPVTRYVNHHARAGGDPPAIAAALSVVVRCSRNALEDALRYMDEAYHITKECSLAARIAQISGCSTASWSDEHSGPAYRAAVLRAGPALAYCEDQLALR